ncbi:MAG: hypothetical protein R2941_19070 [Desulfobacterales bacterium]
MRCCCIRSKGITDLILMPGLVNPILADVKTTMEKAGTWPLWAIRPPPGRTWAIEAGRAGHFHPLLEDLSNAES